MEMTGLDIDKDQIMEIACIITDSKLNIVAESPNLIIHQPQAILSNMNDWCQKQHRKTGLVDACLNSQTSLKTAEEIILNFLKQHASPKISQLAGNSVYMDRYFLMKHMPQVHEYLHYRIIDVSSIKELCRIWNLSIYQQRPKKEFSHRALSDIKESVKELKWYKENLFKL
ncbi:hypothetical protein ABEB36_006703 [Hypothenemus hampei]|uniref:Probable oligoribonuclease n=1 Tax=Hypothenemus hampei TaxID=57062 RepID=A0ABD1ERI0_HYPHA